VQPQAHTPGGIQPGARWHIACSPVASSLQQPHHSGLQPCGIQPASPRVQSLCRCALRTPQVGDSFAGAFYELGLAKAGWRTAPSLLTPEVTTAELAALKSPHGTSGAERELGRRLAMRMGTPWAWGVPAVATVPRRLRTALQDPRQLFDNGDRSLPAVPPYTHTGTCMRGVHVAWCMSHVHVACACACGR
jgi:hypothetical protein